ncbi:MAG: GNAT family N-acetyltransferase [Armatimonadetes bacterium]|jgi:GNAT superfamily N-acetyltransferase|nr:GNAT family N-acetyltransferase [Armatimonadota bacterium]
MRFADLALARRLEAAEVQANREYAQALAYLRPEAGAADLPVAGGIAIYAGPGSPLNHATGIGMAGPVSAADLSALEAFYAQRATPVQLQLCPLADSALPALLAPRGYHLARFLNVLVRPLDPQEAFAAPPAGMKVQQVGPAEREVWTRTVAQGFLGRDDITPAALEVPTPNTHLASATCFLARVNGEPAGGGAVTRHEGLATLFSASTRAAFRRQGVQTALLRARLAFAAGCGCDLAMLRAVPGSASQRNAERLGFRVVYTKAVLVREG